MLAFEGCQAAREYLTATTIIWHAPAQDIDSVSVLTLGLGLFERISGIVSGRLSWPRLQRGSARLYGEETASVLSTLPRGRLRLSAS
jgi:hypothetical protein